MRQIVCIIALVVCLGCSSLAMADQPLTQEGKTSVFQRVVSHPDAQLYADASGTRVIGNPRTFTSFYVYERQNGMIRVGVSSAKSDGWLKSSQTTLWPQAITMVFTDQMGRAPVLFFRDHSGVQDICQTNSIKQKVDEYLAQFSNPSQAPSNSPVIAVEPSGKQGQVSQKDFYLLPVLNIDSQFKDCGTQLLQVACIDPGVKASTQKNPLQTQSSQGMTTGIVFVLDTTLSMKPYIDQTKNIVKTIYDKLQKSEAKDNVAFAIVAFRSNVEKRPDTEYNTLVVSDFTTVGERKKLEKLLDKVEECQASTHSFNEDSLAGVKTAIDSLSWEKIHTKMILLITDSGPLAGDDPSSKTGMTPEGMADYLRTNKIYLTALHIKTPQGSKDHIYAEKSYRQLSKSSDNRSFYVPLKTLSPARGAYAFRKAGERFASTFCTIAERHLKGKLIAKPATKELPTTASLEEQMQHIAEVTGYAMQLQFAGDQNKTRAPQVVNAWIADSDLPSLEEQPNDAPIPVVYPAVLLTKTQLSQLRKQLKLIIQTAEEAFLRDTPKFNFYEQLISAAAQMSRDPSSFNKDPNANLAQKGVLLEVLDGLPYKSRVLTMRQENWINMSTGERQEFIKRLKGLIRRYEEFDRDNTHWEGFGSRNTNEWVYRVPLDILP